MKITGDESYNAIETYCRSDIGITIRQQFAMAAMQGILTASTGTNVSIHIVTEVSVQCADALIAELNKDK